jgi:lysophospholipase L1-like esterase
VRPELLLSLATVLLVLAGLGVAEVALRLFDPRYLDRTRGPDVYSERLGWKLRPGFQGFVHDTWTTVNDGGYRGRDHAAGKAPGRIRIVMLGDSITFGHRVRDDQTFSALLASRTGRFEVLNLGVEGYGTDQELIVLQEEGLRRHPDVVILNFCSNDVLNNALDRDHQDGRTPKPYFTLDGAELRLHDEGLRLSPLRRGVQWLADEAHLYGRLGDLLPRLQVAVRGSEPPADAPRLMGRPEAVEVSIRLVRQIAEVSRRAGARVLLVMHADEPGLLGRSRLSSRVSESPLLAGLPVLDMAKGFRARGLGLDDVLLDYQGHLTPFGNLVVAQEIEVALASL